MSLLAKWLPREGSSYSDAAKKIADVIYPTVTNGKKRMMLYRKEVSAMNKALKTVEINMCGGTWQDIQPEHVPGRCLKIIARHFTIWIKRVEWTPCVIQIQRTAWNVVSIFLPGRRS